MDNRNGKGNVAFFIVRKVKELTNHVLIIQVIEAIAFSCSGFLGGSGIGSNIVIASHFVFLQHFKDELATCAAEIFIVKMKYLLTTFFPAVVACCYLMIFYIHFELFCHSCF